MAGPVADPADARPDPGLQPERTTLAWGRTVLGFVVVATVVLKSAPVHGGSAVLCAIAYQGVAVLVALRNVPRYRRARSQMSGGRPRAPVLGVLALSSVTAVLGLHWLALSG